MADKKYSVLDYAKKFGVSSKEIIRELNGQGIDTPDAEKSIIPDDMIELVDLYFADLYDQDEDHLNAVSKRLDDRRGSSTGRKSSSGGEKNMTQNKPKKKSGDKGGSSGDTAAGGDKELTLATPVIVKDLAEAVGKKANEVISDLIKLGELASMNQAVSEANVKKLCTKYGFKVTFGQAAKAAAGKAGKEEKPKKPANLRERPPVVTFMGHVDHGKTSLQDAIRHTNVTAGESGAITQHIGASTITHQGKSITFIDTPGHAAFSNMRARGANVTDIVVLVVAATEGFKPQTIEAISHATAAGVKIIVAINKMDLPDADPDRVIREMQQHGLLAEEWGGEVAAIRVSAKTGAGLSDLLERILMEAEMLELKADPDYSLEGSVLEAQLEQGLGPIANIIVQNGTLHPGDIVLCGVHYGKVRMLINDKGARVKAAGPSTPVKLVGLSGVPEAGDKLEVFANEREARNAAAELAAERRDKQLSANTISTAEDLFSRLNNQEVSVLNVIIKSDVRGSGEAIAQALAGLPSEKVKAQVVANAVGPVTEGDIDLAAATDSIVIGFHVRVNPGVNDLAKKKNVEIRLYSIIYELIEDITDALAGKLEPERKEKTIGEARILQIFELSKGQRICGCRVDSGIVRVGAKARVRRDKELIYNGEVASLRHFRDDVREVKAGLECGIKLDNFADFVEGDEIELYEVELKKAQL